MAADPYGFSISAIAKPHRFLMRFQLHMAYRARHRRLGAAMSRMPEKTATPPRTRFVVHQNGQGYWIASEKAGFVTGIFAVQRDALRFALSRLQPRPHCRQGAKLH
jgi:hypothetical protein